ncbi:TraK family protein [Xenorhabdus eapokensis]|uniref:Conjugal transfer protein TraK n=1 Tax=Xenorhabdus eapokensis TaxID=1873482 RepID=A0A1Q5TKS6_9GAMM|nr:TraK family protein [Xenorhabdus eapokensis]OKP00828.1 hypothetical protein Xedl_03143 [Xenorhabdus eapokensis]
MNDKNTKTYRGQGRVAFLAHIDLFRTLVEKGYPLKVIYADHKDKLQIGYPQFTKYVNRYILKTKPNGHQKKEIMNEDQAMKANSPGFQHNPNSANTRDDLI